MVTVVATWFRKKKGFAIGIVASGASIAGLIYPMMIKFLIQEVGFNNAQRYTATLTAVTCLFAILIARPNPAHPFRKPETWARINVWVDTHAFRNHSFAWLCAAISFLFFGFYAVFFNLEEWAAETGIGFKDNPQGGGPLRDENTQPDAMRAFWLLSIMNATSTIGRLSSAYLCDHFGAMNVHCFVTTIASLLVLILWTLADTVKSAIAFVVVFGIFSGAVIGLPPASVAHILGPDPAAQAKLGQWTGMMYSCAAVFALTGPVIAGHLITEFKNDFRTVQLATVGAYFIAILGLAVLTGHSGQISLGHGALMAVGAYTTAILMANHGVQDLWTIPIAAVVAGVIGLLAGIPALRLSGLYLALATFGIAIALPTILKKFDHFTGGSTGITLLATAVVSAATRPSAPSFGG